jgi:ABC-type xylose transport system substrate-binding protein
LIKFFREHWILVLVLFLLIIMSIPLLYFGNLLKILDQRNGETFPVSYAVSPKIGICFNNFMEARWLKEQEAMLEEAKSPVITVKIYVAHQSLALQTQQILNLINQNIKVLIINPVSNIGLDDILDEARRRGIKIIQYDEPTAGPADLFIGADYTELGRVQASSLLDNIIFHNYLIFSGPKGSYKAEKIYNEAINVLKNYIIPQSNMITIDLPTWSADTAVNKARVVLTRQKLNGILAPNDLIAGEIINFMKEQKLPLPKITGAGAEITACQRILKDEQLITVYFNYQLMAKTAIACAREFLAHKTPEAPNTIIYNGKIIPAYLFSVYPVTKSNLKSLLIDKIKLYTEKDLVTE